MKIIFKYEVKLGVQVVKVPSDCTIIHFGVDPVGRLCFWAEVNPALETVDYNIQVVGTGQSFPESSKHIASCIAGLYVWHLYEVQP